MVMVKRCRWHRHGNIMRIVIIHYAKSFMLDQGGKAEKPESIGNYVTGISG